VFSHPERRRPHFSRQQGHTKKITDVELHPSSDVAVTCSTDNSVRVWSASAGTCQHELKVGFVELKKDPLIFSFLGARRSEAPADFVELVCFLSPIEKKITFFFFSHLTLSLHTRL
jgi:WD40 repeat protein